MIQNAIIMAGGQGQRLRPLTEQRPKPLLPLLGEPVIGMALRLLHRYGVHQATITLCYRAQDMIHALGQGETYGVRLIYKVEDSPRGTAGSAKDAAIGMDGTVLMMSGDGLTDANLAELYQQHRQSGAVMSVAVKRLDDTAGYGVCETNASGQIVAFLEKPTQPPANALVNMGIYFVEPQVWKLIPETGTYDFGQDVIPDLLSRGMKVQALETDAYWRDIGNCESYAMAQLDILTGRVALPVRGKRVGAAILGRDCQLAENVRITGRCFIGDRSRVESGTVLGSGTVIQPGAVVGPGVRMENACLWENAHIDGETILKNVVVMPKIGNTSLQRIISWQMP